MNLKVLKLENRITTLKAKGEAKNARLIKKNEGRLRKVLREEQ